MRTFRLLAAGIALALPTAACLTGCGPSAGSDTSKPTPGPTTSLTAITTTSAAAITTTTLTDAEACVADLNILETVIRAWTVAHDADPENYPTHWPKDQDSVIGEFLRERSTMFDFFGDGAVPPTITKLPGQCPTTTVYPITPLVKDQIRN